MECIKTMRFVFVLMICSDTYRLLFELPFMQYLKSILDRNHKLPFVDGILINGQGRNGASFTVEQGKTIAGI